MRIVNNYIHEISHRRVIRIRLFLRTNPHIHIKLFEPHNNTINLIGMQLSFVTIQRRLNKDCYIKVDSYAIGDFTLVKHKLFIEYIIALCREDKTTNAFLLKSSPTTKTPKPP